MVVPLFLLAYCNNPLFTMLSDSLEMVGVELKATWSETRKANIDIILTRVTNTVNVWKSGKFMVLEILCIQQSLV